MVRVTLCLGVRFTEHRGVHVKRILISLCMAVTAIFGVVALIQSSRGVYYLVVGFNDVSEPWYKLLIVCLTFGLGWFLVLFAKGMANRLREKPEA